MSQNQVGHALHVLNHTTRRFLDMFSHKKENDELLGTGPWVLHYIAANREHPVYMRDVERHAGDTDARLRRLTLTPKAEALLNTIEEDQRFYENELLKGFTANEIQTVLGYLDRMRSNLDTAIENRQKN